MFVSVSLFQGLKRKEKVIKKKRKAKKKKHLLIVKASISTQPHTLKGG
jgi:hypothetical protein